VDVLLTQSVKLCYAKLKLIHAELLSMAASAAITKGLILNRFLNGRYERIRTSDPFTPSEVRYQAALRTDVGRIIMIPYQKAMPEELTAVIFASYCRLSLWLNYRPGLNAVFYHQAK
jgi:hypothetical protein